MNASTIDTGSIDTVEIDRLAWLIDRHGLGAVTPTQIDGVVEHARTTGASPVLINVLADATEPTNARTRAFGMVALQASRRAA